MMPIERMRPEDFDAVFRLLSQSFPAGAQGTVDCADLLSMAMMIDSGAWIITYADLGQQAFPLRLTSIENPEHFSAPRTQGNKSSTVPAVNRRALCCFRGGDARLRLHAVDVRQNSLRDGECEG